MKRRKYESPCTNYNSVPLSETGTKDSLVFPGKTFRDNPGRDFLCKK